MQVSLEWLSEYIDISAIPAEEIAHGLTMSGLEVEDIEKTGAAFTNIVVAEILEVKPHPNADKLQLAEIFNGTEKKEVVCGAKNIAKGQLVPYASTGSEVLNRKTGEKFTLKPTIIRGIESQGMLCSPEELGLNPESVQEEGGILILNTLKEDIHPGQDIKEVLGIKEDTILHVAPTANRGDEMSILGIAREVSAIFNRTLKYPKVECADIHTNPDFKVEIKDTDTCKYYAIGVIKDVKIKPAPEWMSRRLLASGVRSINNIVDITNYVMLEYGQPLHAFDMDKLGENYLCIRRAYQGEKMTTLDEIERKLSHDTVLIATNKEPVGLAGVMGGFTSEIDDNTKDIALESAYFTPPTNRKSARSVGLRTEACARFERGVDIETVRPSLIRAMQLMVELADAKICGISETGDNKLPNIEITLRYSQIKRILGIDIQGSKCVEILDNLGFELLGKNDFSAKFLVPSYRSNDVTREIDLIEEIGRIYGYDKIEPSLPRKTMAPEISNETITIDKINKILLGQGLSELITSSLIGVPLLNWTGISYNEEEAVKVLNPQSDDYTMLRQSLIPSIIQAAKYNFDQGQKNVWLYEIGKTFHFKGIPNAKDSGVEEKRIIAGVATGNILSSRWHNSQETDFYTLKGTIEALFRELNLDSRIEYCPANNIPYMHPGKTAEIKLLGKDTGPIGYLGELHPDIVEKCKLSQTVYIFEINLEKLISNLSYAAPRYKELPLYPAVYRDIAFIIPQNVINQDITKKIKKVSSNIFKNAEIFDVYQGKHVPEGSKSLAYRITLQDPDATLTDARIDAEITKIKEGLKKSYPGINFRE